MNEARVLMTADAVGGVWTYALELARALVAHDIATTLATMGPSPSVDQIEAARSVPGLELETSDFALEWMEWPWEDVARAGAWLLDLEARAQPLVVHLNGYAHGALRWRSPVVVAGHSCVVSWAEAVGETIARERLDPYRAAVRRGLRAADWVVAPTAAILGALQRLYGPLTRSSVVPNGREAASFPPGEKEPVVFGAGRLWDRAKNADALARIAPRLSWRVVIAGSETVGGTGRLTEREIAEWVGRASIFALPARYEPFGLMPLEAALAGCALVVGDIASLREVWGNAALFVDPNDDLAIAAAIEHLIRNPAIRREMAARARARALAYTPARMARSYARIYRRQRRLQCAS